VLRLSADRRAGVSAMTEPYVSNREEAPPEKPVTLEEAREAYVQKNYILYEESFRRFDEIDGFRFTFCWPVFFAGILWFLYRKMYIESLIIFLIGLVTVGAAGALGIPGGSLPFSACLSVVLALSARWFYWKAVDRRVTRAWEIYGENPGKALAWLRAKGGVNAWVVAVIMVLALAGMFNAIGKL
jgi:hypothetical protein